MGKCMTSQIRSRSAQLRGQLNSLCITPSLLEMKRNGQLPTANCQCFNGSILHHLKICEGDNFQQRIGASLTGAAWEGGGP